MSFALVVTLILWLLCGGLGAYVCHQGLRRQLRIEKLDHVDAGLGMALFWHGFLLFLVACGLAGLMAAVIIEHEMLAEWSEGRK